MKLFVYGTLKEGYALNYVLSKSKKLGTYITKRKGFMMTGFWFPYVWEKRDSNYSIKGELYEVDQNDLRTANRIELSAGYELMEIDKDVWGYVYPKKKDRRSLNIIKNTKEKYYEWRNFNDMDNI
jgi:gamma-glutamylcyclotransferase (GGCT)/AIG2-like uncharacterized protein YtfP